ncbi:hypothetical protein DMN91_004894 [Ooceraea biroi]|uniref:Kinesin motor domain-containing protein n=1 Tax=Ooceraea biroi TaxID=2015173 RepID=A0A3L8DQQ3_OOCBI|nr:hypothetical protein DMN91_004894 [Ooceraea biroi]
MTENTLDSIRPSENPQEDMSYLFGRDPSILAYGQRPHPSKDTKKNLLSLYETEEIESVNLPSENSESQTLQTVKVYLRLKPFPRNIKLTEEQQEAYKIKNTTTLVTRLPILDNNMSTIKQSKSNEIICKKFTFSQTFGPEITQLELFQQTVQQQMTDFLIGHNCTIMTYGTTNSGKSYTLQGTTTSPGLIPRALEFVFDNVATKPHPFYKPLHHCDVISLNALERAQELEAKTKLLTFGAVDKHQYLNSYKQMQKLLQEESIRPSQCHDAYYSIWVSFAEIYNEVIYDLLSNECQKRRVPLKLGTDSNGRAFIKGLKTVYVNSAAEAYQVLMAGQYNLKVAATALNAKSSRSHCIFTITLLKYYDENVPDATEVSTFSFCDLAGSERLKKTLNIGDRLREAQNINTSLLVLGRCLKSIHEGQLTRTKTDAIAPFRESKLTRLFQRALSGKEHLALIVNINPLPNLYIETQNVLNFAAIAKRIVIEKKKETRKKLKSRFSQIVTQSIQTVTDWDATELESVDSQNIDIVESTSEYITSEEYMDLTNENERLKKEVAILKNSALIRDFQSRQEMADKYVVMIQDLEVDWKQRINDMESQHEDALDWTVNQVKDFYEKKLNEMHRKKRKRNDRSNEQSEEESDLDSTLENLNRKYQQIREKNESLAKSLIELKVTKETLIVEKNKACFELGLLKEDLKVAKNLLEAAQKDICLDKDGKAYMEEMTLQLRTKDEQIKNLKEILNEAKDEYITITSDLRKKELCIDEQAKIIMEDEEKIDDFESQLEQLNFCLTERTKITEILEEKLEQQTEYVFDAEGRMLQMQGEIERLKSENLALLKSYETAASRTSTQSEYQEIIIKEELIEESEDTNNTKENGIINTEGHSSQTQLADDVNSVSNVRLNSPDLRTQGPLEEDPESHLQLGTNNEPSKLMVDTGCQVDVTYDEKYDPNNPEKNVCKSTQTTVTAEDVQAVCNKAPAKEATVQTDETVDEVKLQLKELTARHDDIQARYEQECSRVEKLAEELRGMEKTVGALREENHSTKTIMDECRHSKETLEERLSIATEEKREMEEALQSSNVHMEQKIADYKRQIDQLEKNLSTAQDNAQRYLKNLEANQKEFDNFILKCKREKEENVCKSEIKEVPLKNTSDESVKQVDERAERVLELEKNLETITKLRDDILLLNENLERCQLEKDCIQTILDKNEKKLLQLENKLQVAVTKEQEKDTEIATLQKELKGIIQRTEDAESAMKVELKVTTDNLMHAKDTLFQKEQHIKELKIHLENFERSAKLFHLLETNAKERQIENERLRNLNEELRTILTQKEREMDAFMKNRDETVTKYESLVKNQQEELDREKREVMRYQELFRRQLTPTPSKDEYKKLQNRMETLQDRLQRYESSAKAKDDDIMSEDDNSARYPKRRGRRALTAKQEDAPEIIELSGSETKRSTRRNALPPPESSESTETKRTTRRKKLFVADTSFTDIEPSENVPAASTSTRNLRTRRK